MNSSIRYILCAIIKEEKYITVEPKLETLPYKSISLTSLSQPNHRELPGDSSSHHIHGQHSTGKFQTMFFHQSKSLYFQHILIFNSDSPHHFLNIVR